MEIKELKKRQNIVQNKKLEATFQQFNNLCTELKKINIPDDMIILINAAIEQLDTSVSSEKKLKDEIIKVQKSILKKLEKELKIVTKNYYRNLWLVLGMATFGIPLGVAFGTTIGNMGLIGIGLPLGMAIGMAVGTGMDKKAFKEGRQLNLEITY